MSSFISVVIPAYNYGRFLPESISSVLSQSFSDFELIVVDDGSTDDTRRIVARIADPRLRYIYQHTQGLSAARNTGIRHANFEFVTFLDADDLLLPGMLETTLREFGRLSPDYALVACATVRMTETGAPIDTIKEKGAGQVSREYRASDLVLKSRFPCCVLARREVFAAAGYFDINLRSSEDRDMWIRIAEKHRIHFCSRQLVRIRRHSSNMSKNADRMRVNMRRVLAKYFNGKIGSFSELILFLKAHAYNQYEVAWMYHDEGRIPEAVLSLIASLLLWPIFLQPQESVNQKCLFRLRSFARFIMNWMRGPGLLPNEAS